jgi:hypothetical protein
MSAITYFKLNSPYEGDVTKNCSLTGAEVDNNFFTLEGRDVKSVELKDDKIVINLMNGDKLTTENITDGCIKELAIDFDEVNGVLTITKDGVTQTFNGFITESNIHNESEDDDDDKEIVVNNKVFINGSLTGNGLVKKPLGISPIAKTGQYRPVKQIVDITKDEKLPQIPHVFPGDRFLTIENVNEFGYLYNYEGLKKIACKLQEKHSPWRIPTKQDWDDLLNAVEPCEEFKTHGDARSNKWLGKFAGKLLKSKEYWVKEESSCSCDDCNGSESTDTNNEQCSCGRHIPCNPNYCGEWGHCHHRHHKDNVGIDKYGFRVIPSGYANEAKDYLYFKERAYFWTATNHDCRDAYIKVFAYNKSKVLQDIFATDNYLSVRLVKDYDGSNFNEREDILGGTFSTVLVPSAAKGQTIWTSVNIALPECGCDCCVKYVLPNDGEGMEFTKKYFVNEWTGKEWLRKEVEDGESVVVINQVVTQATTDTTNDDDCHCNHDNCHCNDDYVEPTYISDYSEYRVVNGELVDVAKLIFDKVMSQIQPQIDAINGELEVLSESLEQEKEERQAKDAELEQAIADETAAREAKDAELEERIAAQEQALADETAAREAKDAELEERIAAQEQALADEIAAREAKDAELEERIAAQEQALADETAAREAKDAELEQAIADETAAREAKDAELEERIANEEIARAEKDAELEGRILTEEGTEFNPENGILTLKSKDGTNDIDVQFDFNFGTF